MLRYVHPYVQKSQPGLNSMRVLENYSTYMLSHQAQPFFVMNEPEQNLNSFYLICITIKLCCTKMLQTLSRLEFITSVSQIKYSWQS